MADIEYSIKSTLPIKVTVGASEASATICWLGAVKDNTNCLNCEEEKIYCENVYIGANGCVEGESSGRTIEGTITWNGLTVEYVIYQEAAICDTCGSAITECEIINYWVSPYVITPSTSSTTLYWEYWLTNRYENDDCDITREKKLASVTSAITISIPCDQRDREFPISSTTECGEPVAAKYYIQKPDVCCDLSGDCYEINEIVYNPTTVPSSGGEVEFSFDYKKIEIDENCEPKETYGTYFGKWNVPGCDEDTVDCCFNRAITSSFTWNDICGRGDLCVITTGENDNGEDIEISSEGGELTFEQHNDKNTIYLSILREKSFSADCDAHCEFQTVYCLDKDSVAVEYYDYGTGQWINVPTHYDSITNIVSAKSSDDGGYTWEYGGGKMRVKWNYQIITIYEDCTVGINSGSPYTDLVTVYEYNDCDKCVKLKCDNSRVNNNSDNTITITATNSSDEKTVENEIKYKFKKGFCELQKDERQWQFIEANMPSNFHYLIENCANAEEGMGCNEFLLTYVQERKPCDPYCPPCLTRYMIEDVLSGGTDAYGSKEYPLSALMITYREDCDIEVYDYSYTQGEHCLNDWVRVETTTLDNKPAFLFRVSQNDGMYRRGKVMFLHDEGKCKEEVIITQHGDVNEVTPYIPSDCVTLRVQNGSTNTNDGGTVTITAVYTPPVPVSDCVNLKVQNGSVNTDDGGTVTITASGDEICDYKYYVEWLNSVEVDGCPRSNALYDGLKVYRVCAAKHTKEDITESSNVTYLWEKVDEDCDWLTFNQSTIHSYELMYNMTMNDGGEYGESRNCYATCTVTVRGKDPEVCNVNFVQDVVSGPCDDANFISLLDRFNNVITPKYNRVSMGGNTSDVYNYLKEGYDLAVSEYNDDAIGLYDPSLYGNGNVSQWGNNNTYKDKEALSALTSWLMAMQLAELVADEETVTNGVVAKNTQTLLFEKAMEIGGGNRIPLYNNYTIKGDVTVSRLVASALYSKIRGEYSFSQIMPYRTKLGGSLISIPGVKYLGFEDSTEKTCEGSQVQTICDKCLAYVTKIGYAVRENDVLPPAPGPYATVWTDAIFDMLQSCLSTTAKNTLASRQGVTVNGEKLVDPRASIENYISPTTVLNSKHNYVFDDTYANYVASTFNLNNSATPTNVERTVQAVADANDDIKYLFSNDIFYNYATTSECYNRSFTPATSASHNGVIKGVYGKNVTNKDLSSVVTTSSDIRDFFENVAFCVSVVRKTLLNDQYGRMRAGSANDGGIDSQARCTTATTTACTRWNHLEDSSIEGLVGGITRYDANNNPYLDANNNGAYDEGEDRVLTNGTCTLDTEGVVSNTYPSGHASYLWAVAMLLMEIFPNKTKKIYEAGNSSCVSRAIVRAHWYSDTLMGRLNASMHIPILHAVSNMRGNGGTTISFMEIDAIKSIFNNVPDV